jgi:hypothetical protein
MAGNPLDCANEMPLLGLIMLKAVAFGGGSIPGRSSRRS